MTFSIVAHDPETGDLGVAVQSKFPNVGVSIPYAQAGVGAIATQCYCNTSFGPRGLALLGHGASPQQALDILIGGDEQREFRQIGIVDVHGRSASFTGARCFDWAGSRQAPHVAVQGNVLAGAGVLDAMLQRYADGGGEPLPLRLIGALGAGQAAGGDRRGQQSAAVKVVRAGGGYGGHDDRWCELSVCDHPTPIAELERLYAIHRLTYLRSDPAQLVPLAGALAAEVQAILHERGFLAGFVAGDCDAGTLRALHDFMGWENYDERIRDDGLIDLEVLADMRTKHAQWRAARA